MIQGTLLVIPIEEALLYIRPLYLRASGGRIPELTRVVVAYQNRIVMEETLDDALARLFGGPGLPASAPPTRLVADIAAGPLPAAAAAPTGSLASQAQNHYTRAIRAQRDGNWALYGEEIERLGAVLEELRNVESEN